MRKLTYFVMALAMVLGFTQCKKEQIATTENEGEKVTITLKLNNGSRGHIVPGENTASVVYDDGDIIMVGLDGAYVGDLMTTDGSNFSGMVDINGAPTDGKIYFYYLDGKSQDVNSGKCFVNISDQTSGLPVISYACVDYSSSNTYSNVKMHNQCGLVKFNTTDVAGAITISGVNNQMEVDFTDHSFTPKNSGSVTLNGTSGTTRWAILLPQDTGCSATVTAVGYNDGTCDIPEIANNTYHSTGVSVLLWDGDLSKLTNESTEAFATVADGMTITGTLGVNKKVSIAAGATVTLDGVTINGVNNNSYSWAGITCLGDANIILSGENTVKGFYEIYPGIYVPSGNTLTIGGSGSLNVSSNGEGAGIGSVNFSSCGNISITGGTIEATGGNNSAGIGSGFNGSCGNISITGGTIEATGGGYAAGIGCGYAGSCGSITITNGVTNVTAKRGDNYVWVNSKCIGVGFGQSTCGTVTIGGFDYGTTGADPNQDDNMTFIYPAPADPVTWTMSSSFICNTEQPYTDTENGITATLVAGVVAQGESGVATWEISGYYGTINLRSGMDYSSYPATCFPSSLTFSSSNNNITKIVILCSGASGSFPDGWSTEQESYSTKLIWEGDPTQTVILSTTENSLTYTIYGITKIMFYLEE